MNSAPSSIKAIEYPWIDVLSLRRSKKVVRTAADAMRCEEPARKHWDPIRGEACGRGARSRAESEGPVMNREPVELVGGGGARESEIALMLKALPGLTGGGEA